jgi:hypothetical protein
MLYKVNFEKEVQTSREEKKGNNGPTKVPIKRHITEHDMNLW